MNFNKQLKQLEKKRIALDQKIKQARELEEKKARFAATVARDRPELLELDEAGIRSISVPTPSPHTPTGAKIDE